jgi:TonB family protein
MKPALSPITVTTTISLALHASVILGVLQTQQIMQATGKGIHIELVSSSYVSSQRVTEQAARREAAQSQRSQQTRKIEHTDTVDRNKILESGLPKSVAEPDIASAGATVTESIDHDSGTQALARSTSAAGYQSDIVDLLHSKISEHKQYPYMARRQRRQGVARVEFVLNPDGTINDARLVHSSRTRILDKAALEAVQGIEPFEPAKDYLHQPEAFQVDVVFNII